MSAEVCIDYDPASVSVPRQDGVRQIAAVRFAVAERSLTMIRDLEGGGLRERLYASPLDLAFWLADNWWRLRYEPMPVGRPSPDWRLRHEMSSITGSTLWPPWMIYGTGERVVFAPMLTAMLGTCFAYDARIPTLVASAQAFDSGVDVFFEQVRGGLATSADFGSFTTLIDQLRREREDEEYAAWRRLEARLGFDAGAAPDALMEQLANLGDEIGEDALAEAAVAVPGEDSAAALTTVLRAARHGLAIRRDSVCSVTPASIGTKSGSLRPWERAETAAAALRSACGVTGRLPPRTLADLVDVSWDRLRDAPQGPTAYGGVVHDDGLDKISFRSFPHAKPRRFELARALGDAVWANGAAFAPLTQVKTERQQFQKAFAQSFLAPFDEVLAYMNTDDPDDAAIEAAATHFYVGESVIRTLLVNKGKLSRDALAPYDGGGPVFEAAEFAA